MTGTAQGPGGPELCVRVMAKRGGTESRDVAVTQRGGYFWQPVVEACRIYLSLHTGWPAVLKHQSMAELGTRTATQEQCVR